MKDCRNCEHAQLIGEEVATGRKVYECHKVEGKPVYKSYGIFNIDCSYHKEKNLKVYRLFI